LRFRALAWLALAFCSSPHGPVAQEVGPGPFHPACSEAYDNLPLRNGRAFNLVTNEEVKEGAEMVAHFGQYLDVYETYDKDCFVGWGSLQPESKEFLRNNAGILVDNPLDGAAFPFCSAFRISETLIATAHHCAGFAPTFRLFGDPATDIEVIRQVAIGYDEFGTASDLDDWAVYEIAPPKLPFTWDTSTFHGEVLDHNIAFVVTLSQYAWFYKVNEDLDHWLEAVRFSRVNGGQLWFAAEVVPGIADVQLEYRCLYHRVPTFGMMSGAPITILRRFDNGKTIKRYVAGIHLRNGATEWGKAAGRSCGVQPEFNIGARLPDEILELVSK